MNHLNLFYQQLQHYKFLYIFYKLFLFLKFLLCHKMVIYFLVFDIFFNFLGFFRGNVSASDSCLLVNFLDFLGRNGNSDKSLIFFLELLISSQ